MMTILADRDVEGQASLLWAYLHAEGWMELVPLRVVRLADLNLPMNSNDRLVWRFAQSKGMLLLTDNRNMQGKDSLEQTIREENQPTSLPVITIGTSERVKEKAYRERCALRFAGNSDRLVNSQGRRSPVYPLTPGSVIPCFVHSLPPPFLGNAHSTNTAPS